MLQKLFSIYDLAAQAYSPPFVASTLGIAIRSFTEVLSNPQSSPGKYPADFQLMELGEIDLNLGQIAPYLVLIKHGSGVDFQPLDKQ